MKTIQFIFFLFLSILIGCNSKNNNQEISKKDSSKVIVKKLNSSKNCNCDENPKLKDLISCDTTVFTNGAKIYRQYNCDSSWLVFQNKKIIKSIFSLDKDLIELTDKLGYVEWDEYENSILIENKTISGCCQPYEYDLFDKENGDLIKKLGKDIYIGEPYKDSFFVSLDSKKAKLIFFNFKSRKTASISYDFNKIDKTIFAGFMKNPEELFHCGSIINGVFKIKYQYKLQEKDVWKYEKIVIDLNKAKFK